MPLTAAPRYLRSDGVDSVQSVKNGFFWWTHPLKRLSHKYLWLYPLCYISGVPFGMAGVFSTASYRTGRVRVGLLDVLTLGLFPLADLISSVFIFGVHKLPIPLAIFLYIVCVPIYAVAFALTFVVRPVLGFLLTLATAIFFMPVLWIKQQAAKEILTRLTTLSPAEEDCVVLENGVQACERRRLVHALQTLVVYGGFGGGVRLTVQEYQFLSAILQPEERSRYLEVDAAGNQRLKRLIDEEELPALIQKRLKPAAAYWLDFKAALSRNRDRKFMLCGLEIQNQDTIDEVWTLHWILYDSLAEHAWLPLNLSSPQHLQILQDMLDLDIGCLKTALKKDGRLPGVKAALREAQQSLEERIDDTTSHVFERLKKAMPKQPEQKNLLPNDVLGVVASLLAPQRACGEQRIVPWGRLEMVRHAESLQFGG